MSEKVFDFTIGADPEFAIVNRNNRVIQAGDYFSDDNGEQFGCDGNGITFEVRPDPSKEPLQVVNNIHDIFVRQVIAEPEFLKFKWLSGSFQHGYPLGGHVHFGISNRHVSHEVAVNFLDHYVGLISLLLEVKRDGKRRRDDDYGSMGDYREQEWGFEYRPMSSWLSSPYIAAAMLCLSKTVMFEVMNNPNFEWHKLAQADDFYLMRQSKILEHFPTLWKDITKMRMYQVYKPYLDLIYFLVKNKLTWIPPTSMKECWGVADMSVCFTNKLSLDAIWARFNADSQTA